MSTTQANGKLIGVVEQVTRLRNSVNGGPRWRFELVGGTVLETERDAQIAWSIHVWQQWKGTTVELTLDKGYITNVLALPTPNPEQAAIRVKRGLGAAELKVFGSSVQVGIPSMQETMRQAVSESEADKLRRIAERNRAR